MMRAAASGTLLLTQADVAGLLTLDDVIAAVEDAFRMHGEGRAMPPAVLGVHVPDGGFHVKAAALDLTRPYVAAKLNANFPGNMDRHGLPTIQGVVALCDARNGRLLALMDSIEITILRTGAATAVATKYLAREGPVSLAVAGCGHQGRVSVRTIARVRPLTRVRLWDIEPARAARLAADLGAGLSCPVEAVASFADAARASDVVVTCTPSTRPLLAARDVTPGAFVAAVGADNPHKHEIAVDLMAASAIIADVTDQCATLGDLHHAIDAGVLRRDDVRAELGQVVAGLRAGRHSPAEVVVFDSTGTALQDVAAAALAYERAVASGRGLPIALA